MRGDDGKGSSNRDGCKKGYDNVETAPRSILEHRASKARNRRKRIMGGGNSTVLREIQKDFRRVMLDMKESQTTEQANGEWKIVGNVLDRLFFILFLMTLSCTAVVILLPAYLNGQMTSLHRP